MAYYLTKIAVTSLLIVLISEIARRNTLAGALLASIPLVSVLAMVWMYVETRDLEKISALSTSVFWLVLPSLVLFVAMPLLLKQGLTFYPSLGLSVGLTIVAYGLMLLALGHAGIKL